MTNCADCGAPTKWRFTCKFGKWSLLRVPLCTKCFDKRLRRKK